MKTPDARRAMPPEGAGAQKHPASIWGTAQGPKEFHYPCNTTGSKVILKDLNVTIRKICFSTLATSKHSKLNITTALGDPLFGNCGGKGTGVVGGQTVMSMGCAANQRNIVCQSDYALEAINGAGNDLTRLENKRRSGSADLEKSDLSRDFFSCLDCDSDRKDFFDFF